MSSGVPESSVLDGTDPRKVWLRAGDGQRTDWARSRSRRLRAAHEPGRREDSKAHHMLGWSLHERKILLSAQADARTLTHCASPRSPRGIVPSSSSTRPGARPSNRADQIGGALSRRAPRGAKGTSRSQLPVKPTTAARPRGPAPHQPVRAEYTDKPPRAWKMTPVAPPLRPALSLQLRQCQCTDTSAGRLTFSVDKEVVPRGARLHLSGQLERQREPRSHRGSCALR